LVFRCNTASVVSWRIISCTAATEYQYLHTSIPFSSRYIGSNATRLF
jgi:hypothetical protein